MDCCIIIEIYLRKLSKFIESAASHILLYLIITYFSDKKDSI